MHIFGQHHHELTLSVIFGAGERAATKNFCRNIVRKCEIDFGAAKVVGEGLELVFTADEFRRFDLCATGSRRNQHEEIGSAGHGGDLAKFQRAALLQFDTMLVDDGLNLGISTDKRG